jgi:hypothetical protein
MTHNYDLLEKKSLNGRHISKTYATDIYFFNQILSDTPFFPKYKAYKSCCKTIF